MPNDDLRYQWRCPSFYRWSLLFSAWMLLVVCSFINVSKFDRFRLFIFTIKPIFNSLTNLGWSQTYKKKRKTKHFYKGNGGLRQFRSFDFFITKEILASVFKKAVRICVHFCYVLVYVYACAFVCLYVRILFFYSFQMMPIFFLFSNCTFLATRKRQNFLWGNFFFVVITIRPPSPPPLAPNPIWEELPRRKKVLLYSYASSNCCEGTGNFYAHKDNVHDRFFSLKIL